MTSNLGSQIIQEAFELVDESNKETIIENTKGAVFSMLKQTIRPEFLNRIDELILFQPLMKKEIRAIIDIQLNALRSQLNERGIQISFSAYAVDYLTEHGFDPQFGARPLKRLIQKAIVNPLSKKLLERDFDSTKPLVVDVFDGMVVFRNQLCPEIA